MRQKLNKLNDIFSWIVLFVSFALLVFTIFTVTTAAKTGESVFLFGYRPVLVLTGSMEPYMMTNGICITEKVDDMDDIEVGDVITFHINNEAGEKLLITHRIVSIDDGYINTKGDNNYVTDDLMLTIDNVEAKVVCVFNQTAWLVAKWQTTNGKVMILSFVAALILGYFALKLFFYKPEEEASSEASSEDDKNDEITRLRAELDELKKAQVVKTSTDSVPVAVHEANNLMSEEPTSQPIEEQTDPFAKEN